MASSITTEQLDIAWKEAGWDGDRARKELDRCRDYNANRHGKSYDWSRKWQDWCQQGRWYDDRDRREGGRKRSGFEEVIDGLRDWVNQRE
jgi:hypothetical protein